MAPRAARRLRLARAVCVALLAGAGSAAAGNDEGLLLGNQAALTGGAVTATISEGSGIWYNPAGIAALGTQSIDVSASVYGVRSYSAPRFLTGRGGGSADVSLTELVIVPTALAFVRPLSSDLKLGLGLFAPRANDYILRAELDGGVDGHWIFTQAAVDRVTFGGASLAWNATPRFRLGGSALGLYRFTQTELQFAGGTARGSDDVVFISSSDIESRTTVGAMLSLGIQWDVASNWKLGLTFRSPTVNLYRNSSDSAFLTSSVQTPSGPKVTYLPASSAAGASGFTPSSPAQARFGIAYERDHDWIALDGDISPGLSDSAGRELNPHFNLRLGGMFAVGDRLALGAGLFTDRDSQPHGASGGPLHFYGASAGLRWGSLYQVQDRHAKVKSFDFTTTLGLRYAYGRGDAASLLVGIDRMNGEAGPAVDVGATKLVVQELMLHLGSGFYFR